MFSFYGFTLAIYIASILGITGIVLEILSKKLGRLRRLLPAIYSAAYALVVVLILYTPEQSSCSTSSLLIFDSTAKAFSAIIAVLTLIVFLSSFPFAERCPECSFPYFGLLTLSSLGAIFLTASSNLVFAYVSWELMNMPAYALVALNYRQKQGAEAALKFFVYGVLSSSMILYGFTQLFGAYGELNACAISPIQGLAENAELAVLAIIFMVVGFGVKLGTVPFHMWIPDTYEGAHRAVTAYLSSATKLGAFIIFYRLSLLFAGTHAYQLLVSALAALTMTLGNLYAISQENVVRLLAYGSIAQTGYLLSSTVILGSSTMPALFYAGILPFMEAGAFIAAGIFRDEAGLEKLADYSSAYKKSRLLAAALTIYLLSLSGFPIFSGFVGKLLIIEGLVGGGYLWLAVLLALNSAVSLAYYSRLLKTMFFEEVKASKKIRMSMYEQAAVAAAAAASIALGIYPQLILSGLNP